MYKNAHARYNNNVLSIFPVVSQMKCELQKSHKSSWKTLSTELTKRKTRSWETLFDAGKVSVCAGFTFLLHLQYKDKSSRFAVGLLCVMRLFSRICEEILNNLFSQIILFSCQVYPV